MVRDMTAGYQEELRRALGPDRPVRFLATTTSTNSDALAWASGPDAAPSGAVVVADGQTAGRGRWGRHWESAPGKALLFSLVLRPSSMPLERLGLLTSAMGVACADAIGDLASLAPSLKWPNDVSIRSRKVAGILFETQMTGDRAETVIAGVGVNTHWSLDEIPEDLRARATSLAIETGEPPGRGALLDAILKRFEPLYEALCDGLSIDDVIRRADELSELRGAPVDVTWPDGRVQRAVAGGIAPSGGLQVSVDGEKQVVDIAEVTMIREAPG